MCRGKEQQPLFEGCCVEKEELDNSPAAMQRAGKAVVDKLLKIRRGLAGEESLFLTQINDCIETLRAHYRTTGSKREELVLWAIEKSMAKNVAEIVDDTRIDITIVKEIVRDLHARGIVYQVRRYIPGSDRQWFLLKSRRVENIEAIDPMFAVEKQSDRFAAAAHDTWA